MRQGELRYACAVLKNLWMVVALAACVRRPALTLHEQCADRGMVLAGVTMSSGGSVGVARAGGQTVVATGRRYDEEVSCRVPETRADQCVIEANALSAAHKFGFGVIGRNFLIGVGYVAFILPGFAFYLIFDSQADRTANEARKMREVALERCELLREIP